MQVRTDPDSNVNVPKGWPWAIRCPVEPQPPSILSPHLSSTAQRRKKIISIPSIHPSCVYVSSRSLPAPIPLYRTCTARLAPLCARTRLSSCFRAFGKQTSLPRSRQRSPTSHYPLLPLHRHHHHRPYSLLVTASALFSRPSPSHNLFVDAHPPSPTSSHTLHPVRRARRRSSSIPTTGTQRHLLQSALRVLRRRESHRSTQS